MCVAFSGMGVRQRPEDATHLSQVLPSQQAGTKDAVLPMLAEPSVKDGSAREAPETLCHLDNIPLELSILYFNLPSRC